jgi:aminoglycoside 3-N-acetyltransferase
MSVTKTDLISAIDRLGLRGKPVCAHVAVISLGGVEGGPQTVIEAFVDSGCTLMLPTNSFWHFWVLPPAGISVRQNGWSEKWNQWINREPRIYQTSYRETNMDMGVLAHRMAKDPRRQRGNHALCSFSAIGPQAEELVAGQSPVKVFAPLEKLIELEGSVLLAGTGLEKMSLIHLAEQRAGRRLFRRWALDPGGQVESLEAGGCSDGFEKLAPTLQSVETHVKVGHGLWRCFPAGMVLELATEAIRRDPQITKCARENCERCHDAILGGPIFGEPVEAK